MDSEVAQVVDRIATELGTTAQYLWPHMVRYTYGKSLAATVFWVLLLVPCFAAMGGMLWGFKKSLSEPNFFKGHNSDDTPFTILFMTGILVVGFITLLVTAGATGDIAGVVSPEGKAVYDLIGKIKK